MDQGTIEITIHDIVNFMLLAIVLDHVTENLMPRLARSLHDAGNWRQATILAFYCGIFNVSKF
jgi:hypothetical protein